MKKFSGVLLFAFLFFFFIKPAHAYLDPGTGSMLLQGLLAGIMAVGVTLGIYWRRLKAFFNRSEENEGNDEESRQS